MGTAYRGTQEEVRALNTYIKLMRAASSVMSRLAPSMKDNGLTPSQFGVLEALHHLGPLCQRDIGEKLLTSGGNVTMVVDNLEKRKLVRRQRSEKDRRFIMVALTRRGQRHIQQCFSRHVISIVNEMRALTPTEQEELGRLCRALGRGGSTSGTACRDVGGRSGEARPMDRDRASDD